MKQNRLDIGRCRWTVCALLFFATTINYIDRQVLGILAPDLQRQIGWSEVEYGYIVTAFQLAYALGLLFAGKFIDRFGTRTGYAASVGFWSVAAVSHALARTPLGFGAARFALGLGEAGNFPAAIKSTAEWFPKKERALATGIFNSGANLGAVVAPLIVPWLTLTFGWPAAFVATGLLGFIWLAFWIGTYEKPELHRRLSRRELDHILSDPPEASTAKMSWREILRLREAWAFIIAKFLTDPIWWFYLYWLPKLLNERYGLGLADIGLPLIAVYTMTTFGSIGGGWLSSILIKKGAALNRARKTVMLIAALSIVPVFLAAKVSSLWLTVFVVGLAAAAHQGWSANLFTTSSDMFPKRAVGSVVGLGGMAGSLGGMLLATATGYILERTGSYLPLLILAGSVYLLALLIFHLLVPKIHPVDF